MTARIKILTKKTAYATGCCSLYRVIVGPSGKRLFILMYHDLQPDGSRAPGVLPYGQAPTRTEFQAHVRELARRHHVVSLGATIADLRSGKELERDSVAITFDDGFASFYTIAYPILRQFGLSATVFLVTEWVGAEALSWWQHLREMIARADFSNVKSAQIRDVLGVDVPSELPTSGPNDTTRIQFRLRLEPLMWPMTDDVRNQSLRKLQQLLFPEGDFTADVERILSWEQVREMADGGIEFGSHTETHLNIPFADAATIEKEIAGSKLEIENKIQRKVTGFAYPYGRALQEYATVEPILRRLGFTYACHACWGNNSSSSNPFYLSRGALPLTTSAALINYALFRGFILGNGKSHAPRENSQHP